MRLKRAVVGFCAALAVPGLGLLGCGGDKGNTASDSDGASASESASSTGNPGSTGPSTPTEASGSVSATEGDDAGSMSASMSGTTEISGGMSASMSGSESGDESTSGGSSSTGSTGMISGGGETSASTSTGEPVSCADFNNEAECMAAECMAITARPFFDDQATWCLDPPSFLACLEQAACDDVITTACKGQTKYQFNNGCLPPGFAVCLAPPDAGMDGYADCT